MPETTFIETTFNQRRMLALAAWLIAAAAIAILIARLQEDEMRVELTAARAARRRLEAQLDRERDQHRRELDGALDEINRHRTPPADDEHPGADAQ